MTATRGHGEETTGRRNAGTPSQRRASALSGPVLAPLFSRGSVRFGAAHAVRPELAAGRDVLATGGAVIGVRYAERAERGAGPEV